MSVCVCNRNGCANVMCDRYSEEWGYICDECLDELIQLGINQDIGCFMFSRKKPPHPTHKKDALEYFHSVFHF